MADVSDPLKTKEMYIKAVDKDLDILVNVADCFAGLKLVEICDGNENYCNDNEFAE